MVIRESIVEGQPFLIEEKIIGENLEYKKEQFEILKKNEGEVARSKIQEAIARDLLSLAKALKELNLSGIFHRDLGIDEVFVLPNGEIKFTDLALSETKNVPVEDKYAGAAKRAMAASHISWFLDRETRELVMFNELAVSYSAAIPSRREPAQNAFGYRMVLPPFYMFFDNVYGRIKQPMESVVQAKSWLTWDYFIDYIEDPAMVNNSRKSDLGGIDFTSDQLNLDIDSKDGAIVIPSDPAQWQNVQINGLSPQVINIAPVNLNVLLGIAENDPSRETLAARKL